MTTSGTIAFNLSNMDIVLEAFERAQVRPTALTRSQLISAYRSINLELSTWVNRGVNLWGVDLQTIAIVAGTPSYTCPTDTIQILDMYYATTSGSVTTDRILYPISRTDYAAIPYKLAGGMPNSFWFDRLAPAPTITFWPVPTVDATISYYRTRQLQDANITGIETPDIPYRFMEALCAGLAARLALKFNPKLYAVLLPIAKEAWAEAAMADVEKAPFYLVPDLGGYFQ